MPINEYNDETLLIAWSTSWKYMKTNRYFPWKNPSKIGFRVKENTSNRITINVTHEVSKVQTKLVVLCIALQWI